MRALLLRSLIGFLALSFAASGVAAHYCNTVHHTAGDSAAVVAPAALSQHAHGGEHGDAPSLNGGAKHQHAAQHQHDEPGHQHGSDDPAPSAADDACTKCCGTCTLVTGVAPVPATAALFVGSAATFACRAELCSGTTLRVDPGIPKRTS